jgi:hypothetical protein
MHLGFEGLVHYTLLEHLLVLLVVQIGFDRRLRLIHNNGII